MNIGILGTGQLARMLILAGAPMGFHFSVYGEEPSPSTQAIAEHTSGKYGDINAIRAWISTKDIITYENENIPVETIASIEKIKPVYPSSAALTQTQDRLYEKNLFRLLDIPTPRYCKIDNVTDLEKAIHELGLPLVLKSRRGGYDGKNQWLIKHPSDMGTLQKNRTLDFIAEEFIKFDREVSIIGSRDTQGNAVFYDLCENQHENGILISTQNKPHDPLFKVAKKNLLKIMNHFEYVGTITLECFVKDTLLIANEIAPRVHNSGHWTIEGALTSQFENHIRACAGLPLGLSDSIHYSTMFNCIGKMPERREILKIPGAHYHDYQKKPMPQRKLGHVTCIEQNNKAREATIPKFANLFNHINQSSLFKGTDIIESG